MIHALYAGVVADVVTGPHTDVARDQPSDNSTTVAIIIGAVLLAVAAVAIVVIARRGKR